MKWEIQNKLKIKNEIEELVNILLENRGLKTKKEKDDFLNPKLEDVTVDKVGIDKKQLAKAIKRIQSAIDKKEQIVVFGDYDVDGITGSAILWETLYGLGANVLPYIPHRIDEGYGLSIVGIKNLELTRLPARQGIKNIKLIITVDNGIVANEAVDFARKQGIDVVITDHHVPSDKLPEAYSIVHTTKLCGAGVAWILSQEIRNPKSEIRNKSKIQNTKFETTEHLELAALGTIADMVPLVGANRTLAVYGLRALQRTKRSGLQALFAESGIEQETIGVYEVGHMIAPRLNAAGRMATAMDSLRLLCTKDAARARQLAAELGQTNKERQVEMIETAEHAIQRIKNQELRIKKLLFVAHKQYQQGTIGLVAGKLAEMFYRPVIVVSIGKRESKASARSVKGFNMIEFLRQHSKYFVNVGGHPMAAGFTIETEKITLLQSALEQSAEKILNGDVLARKVRVDCELPIEMASQELYEGIQRLAPFGVGNPEPAFVSNAVVVESARLVGRDGKHLKLELSVQGRRPIGAVAFGMGERRENIVIGEKVDVLYTLSENKWNGNKKIELKIKDIKI